MRKHMKRIISIVMLLFILISLPVFFMPSRTPGFKDVRGKAIPNSIAELNKVKFGGINQYILIRGKNVNNPVLFFLHGGPGYPQINYSRKYLKVLEENFTVVDWDQRGSGKSYSLSIPSDTMNREQFISDTKEVIDYLCKKLKKEKVVLVGHSWGSELGMYVVDRYPDKINAYIGIGQVIDGTEGEVVSYDYVLKTAKELNNKKAVEDLEKIGKPPYKNPVKDTLTERKWLSRFGGVERKINTLSDIIWGSIFSQEYTGIDGIKFALGSKFTSDTMWGKNEKFDLMKQMPQVKVPIYFCAGRYDYNTPSTLVEKYYTQLKAPKKGFFWFEKSAHFPHFEEPEKFKEIVERIVNETDQDYSY